LGDPQPKTFHLPPTEAASREEKDMNPKIRTSRWPWRAVVLALGALLLILPGPVLGAIAEPEHTTFRNEPYEDVVCGIVVEVLEEGQLTTTLFKNEDGSFHFRGTAMFMTTFTAGDGDSVVVTDANQLTFSDPIIDEEAGTITFVNTLRGVLEKMKLANGSVLFVDAGYATDAITFDLETEEFISFESIVSHGRSPLGQSGFTLWCEAFIAALG